MTQNSKPTPLFPIKEVRIRVGRKSGVSGLGFEGVYYKVCKPIVKHAVKLWYLKVEGEMRKVKEEEEEKGRKRKKEE